MLKNDIDNTIPNTLFCGLFSEYDYLLQLYHALHPEDTYVIKADFNTITLKATHEAEIHNELVFCVKDRLIILLEAKNNLWKTVLVRSNSLLKTALEFYIYKNNINLYSNDNFKMPIIEMYVIYKNERGDNPEYISLQEEFFPDGCCFNFRMKILYLDNSEGIINQYIRFFLILDNQKAVYGSTQKAIEETIRICKEENILVEYINNRSVEVQNIIWNLLKGDNIGR